MWSAYCADAQFSNVIKSTSSLPQLITVAEVATSFRMSVRSVRRMTASDELPIVRIGRAVRITSTAVESFMSQHDTTCQAMNKN